MLEPFELCVWYVLLLRKLGFWVNLGKNLDLNPGLKISFLRKWSCAHAQVKTTITSRLLFGQHRLSCRGSVGRFSRHSALNEIVKRALGSLHIPTILEPPGLYRFDSKRPDEMFL